MTINGLLSRTLVLNTDIIATEVMKENAQVLGETNLKQLYAGKTREGKDLSPTYFEDPYFETYAQAQAYSEWKDRITPNPLRKPGVPNLIINGYYYASRKVQLVGDKIVYGSDYIEKEIHSKYGDVIDGLGGQYKIEFLDEFIRPRIQEEITKITGLKFSR